MAIVAELEYAADGGAWTPLTTYPLAETRYAWDLAAFPDGTTLAVRVRRRDLADDTVSAWSATRTLTVARATPAPVASLAALPAMRGLTAGERAVYAALDRQEHVLVEVRDEDGTWHDLAALGGEDFFVSARVTDSPDQPVLSAELTLFREVRDSEGVVQSLAPFMEGSALNVRASDGTYSPLIQWGRRLRIRTAVLTRGATPAAGDWVGVFEGTLDDPEWGAGLTVTARDDGKRLQDTIIAEAKPYGSDDGTALADVLRQMLADNGCGDLTLCVVGDPDWFLRPFTQDADVSLMDAMTALVLQIGWDLRFRWTDRTTLQLVLSEPTRANVSAATPIYTLSPSRYLDVGAFATESDGVRNSIRVAYLDRAAGEMRTARALSPASIEVYGLRPMQLAYDASSNIDTQAEAEALATTVLSDLAEPSFRVQVDARLLGALGRGDVVTLAPNGRHHDTTQQAAVVALVHEMGRSGGGDGASSCTTTLTLRGRALGAYRQWLRREAPPSPALGPVVVRARAERVSADDTTETWRLYADVTRGGRPTGQVAALTVTALGAGVTITSGPAVGTAAPQGTLWTFARPTGAPSRFTYRATVIGALADEDAEPITPQGVAIDGLSRLTWSEFALVEAESDALTSHYRGVLTDADGAATGDATVVLTRTGPDDTVTPTTPLTGALPLTIEFDVPRQAFRSGESVVEAYGSAPGVQGDWERVTVAAVERDTVQLAPVLTQVAQTATTASYTGTCPDPLGALTPALALTLVGCTLASGTGTSGSPWVVNRPAFGVGAGRATLTATAPGRSTGTDAADVAPQGRDTITPRFELRRGTTFPDRVDLYGVYYDRTGAVATPDALVIVEGASYQDPAFPGRTGTQANPWVIARAPQGAGGRRFTVRADKAGVLSVTDSETVEPREVPQALGRIRRVGGDATTETLRFEAIRTDGAGTLTLTITKPDGSTEAVVVSATTAYGTTEGVERTYTRPGAPTWAADVRALWTATGLAPGTATHALTDAEGARRAWTGFNSDGRVVTGLEDLADVGGRYAAQIAAASKAVFLENFDRPLGKPDELWEEVASLAHTITSVTDSTVVGGAAIRVTGQAWRVWKGLIPFNPNALYRVRARVRGGAAPGTFYAGFTGIAADRVTRVNTAGLDLDTSQHHVAAQGATLTPGVWRTFTGWLKGSGTWSGPSSSPTAPSQVHADVRYLRPTFIVNYPMVGGAGVTDLDYLAVDEFDADGQVRIYKAIDASGNLNPTVRQSDDIAVRKLANGAYELLVWDGASVDYATLLNTTFQAPPELLFDADYGGLVYEPSLGTAGRIYRVVRADSADASGCDVTAKLVQRGAPSPQTHAMTPASASGLGGELSAVTTAAPARDGLYTVEATLQIDGTPVFDATLGTYRVYVRVEVILESLIDGVATERARTERVLHVPDASDATPQSQSWPISLSATVSGMDTTDALTLRIATIDPDHDGMAPGATLSGGSVAYTTSAGDTAVSLTPDPTDVIRLIVRPA